MVKRNLHHTFPVQSPHTMDAILFRDVNKRNCGYCPLSQGTFSVSPNPIINYVSLAFPLEIYSKFCPTKLELLGQYIRMLKWRGQKMTCDRPLF